MCVLLICVGAVKGIRRPNPYLPRLTLTPATIFADGSDVAVLEIDSEADSPPLVTTQNANSGGPVVEAVVHQGKQWRAYVRAGVMPGDYKVLVGRTSIMLTTTASVGDSHRDGTPDFLRLTTSEDQRNFRRWFTYLAEAQYQQAAYETKHGTPREIVDCSALIRYAYREALVRHDAAWADAAGLRVVPAFESIKKYQYPFTPLGASLFRVSPGAFGLPDLSNQTFLQFADAKTLRQFNAHSVGRDLRGAQPGDLLFYRQSGNSSTYHSMIYLGASQFAHDDKNYVVYHTGPTGKDPGELRRLTVEELIHFRDPNFRAVAENPQFLGVARWNILRENVHER